MHDVSVLKFDFELGVWQGINDGAFHFNLVFFCHLVCYLISLIVKMLGYYFGGYDAPTINRNKPLNNPF